MSEDVWGGLYRDHLEGRPAPHVVVRDDGHETRFPDAGMYFAVPPEDEAILATVRSPVLELACGAGRYARHLEERGHRVVATDASPGAVDVCRRRGCADARLLDLHASPLPEGPFATVLLMGVCLGMGRDEAAQVEVLGKIHRVTAPDGVLIGTTFDPTLRRPPETDEERAHAAYQEPNRRDGRPIGIMRIAIDYRGARSSWNPVWLMTAGDVARTAAAAGWRIAHTERHGTLDTYVLAKAGP